MPNLDRIRAELAGWNTEEPPVVDEDRASAAALAYCKAKRIGTPSRVYFAGSLKAAFRDAEKRDRNERLPTYASRVSRHIREFGDWRIYQYLDELGLLVYGQVEDIAMGEYLKLSKINRNTYKNEYRTHYKAGYMLDRTLATSPLALLDTPMLDLLKSSIGWVVSIEDELALVPFPTVYSVRRGERDRLSSSTGPAIRWRDGAEHYYIDGIPVTRSLVSKLADGSISVVEAMKIKNADLRSRIMMSLGPEKIFAGCKSRLLDIGQRGTRLYEVSVPGIANGTQYIMHMKDASTPREFYEWVPPNVGWRGDAELCQANAWGITLDQWLSVELEG